MWCGMVVHGDWCGVGWLFMGIGVVWDGWSWGLVWCGMVGHGDWCGVGWLVMGIGVVWDGCSWGLVWCGMVGHGHWCVNSMQVITFAFTQTAPLEI